MSPLGCLRAPPPSDSALPLAEPVWRQSEEERLSAVGLRTIEVPRPRAQRPFGVTWQLTGPRDPGASVMFCEKAMELVRELHRAPEGQLPAFNVRSGGRGGACRGPGLGAGPSNEGAGPQTRGGACVDSPWARQLCLSEDSSHMSVAGFALPLC